MVSLALVSLVGPLAMISYKPRQARKGATVVADSCAVVRLMRGASEFLFDHAVAYSYGDARQSLITPMEGTP